MPAAKKPMTKTQLIQHFADKFELTKAGAKAIIEEFAEVAVAQTKKVGEFTIPGIGKLVKQKRKARKGHNPATGEAIRIPAKTVVKMRIQKVCKEGIVPPKKKK